MGEIIQYALLAFFAGAILLSMWNDRQENKRMKLEAEQKKILASAQVPNNSSETTKIGTRDLFLNTLTKIGCQYQLGEGDDNRIFFAYQGENFFADTTNDIMYVHLWDTHWGHVELYDIDEVSRLRKAINTSNLNTAITTVFTIDEDGNNRDVHSKSTIPFISSMPNLEDYLKVELNEFFRSHQMVGTEMRKLREQEQNA
jgi:hypothetical protein